MVSTPLNIGLKVKIDGTLTANINITVRNEATDQSTSKNSNASGDVIFNLGSTKDFSKGWNVGNKISVSAIYRVREQTFSFTIPTSGVDIVLTDRSGNNVGSFKGGFGLTEGNFQLESKPDIPSIRYFTTQEFLDYFNLKDINTDAENGVELLQLTRIGEEVEGEIDSLTNSKFDDNNGLFYSPSVMEGGESPEFHDVRFSSQRDYFTRFRPINSVTTFQKNNNGEGQSTDFETLTAANNDININKPTGRIRITDSGEIPEIGAGHVKITYTFGRGTTPQDIKQLAILMTARRMVQAAFIKSRILRLDETTTSDISEFTNFRDKIIRRYKNIYFAGI